MNRSPSSMSVHWLARAPSVGFLALLVLCAGCASTRGPGATGHFEGRTWTGAWDQFSSHESQWIAPAALAVATPIVWAFDKDISEDSLSQSIFNSNTKYGDELAIGLGAIPLVFGAVEAAMGDSRDLEVGAEALSITMAATYALKSVINKNRPDGSSNDSFPSAHTSFAFAGATLIARTLQDRYGTWVGYLSYLPAAYVGISRLEGQRHYLADITFGAALGLVVTNLVYNAHFGGEGSPGIFGGDHGPTFSIGPAPDGPGLAAGLDWSF